MRYVRDTYGVPVVRHGLVRQLDCELRGDILVVRSCSNYVHACRLVELDARKPYVYRFHPLSLEYKTNDGWFNPNANPT